jgi:DNA invertase Pin-like site-specific DNA recombinase
MKVKYIRVSHFSQNTSRQEENLLNFDRVFIDKISGTVPFFERPKGKLILEMVKEKTLSELYVHAIDRLGRNLISTLETINFFNENSIPIHIQNLGLKTIEDGKINPNVQFLIQVMSMFSQIENDLRKERQLEGIKLAQQKGKYKGRKKGSKETIADFLNKPKNKRALSLLKEGNLSQREIARCVGLHFNTILKLKKFGLTT